MCGMMVWRVYISLRWDKREKDKNNSVKERETKGENDFHVSAKPCCYLPRQSPTHQLNLHEKQLSYRFSRFIHQLMQCCGKWCGIQSDKRWLFFSHPQCFSHLTLRSSHQLNSGRENPIWAGKHWFMEPAFWQSAAKHLSTTARRRVMGKRIWYKYAVVKINTLGWTIWTLILSRSEYGNETK